MKQYHYKNPQTSIPRYITITLINKPHLCLRLSLCLFLSIYMCTQSGCTVHNKLLQNNPRAAPKFPVDYLAMFNMPDGWIGKPRSTKMQIPFLSKSILLRKSMRQFAAFAGIPLNLWNISRSHTQTSTAPSHAV